MEHDAFLPRQTDQPGQHKQQQPQQQQQQRQGYGSDDSYEHHPHMVEGGILSDDQAFAMLHHGSVSSSPTSASLLYHGSPTMPNQYQAPLDGYHGHTSRAMSPSPHMAPVDPYRSAYSQQQLYQYQQQQHPYQQQPYSPYQTHLTSHGSSPMVSYDDVSSSHDSRYSGSTKPNQFPMYSLSRQNSNQALTAAYQHHQQQLQHAQNLARRDSSIDLAGAVRPHSQQSMTLLSPQPMRAGSKTVSSSTGSRRLQSETEEEEENAEILQKVSQSGSRSGMTLASRSTGKNSKRFGRGGKEHKSSDIDDDDEEEGQEKGANRQRDGKRCWCCSRRMCVYMSFLFLLCLSVALFFVLPRSPAISFVSAQGPDPVFSRGRIQESFTLQMRVDSSDNYLPIKLSSVEMTVWWKLDGTKIGTNEGLSSSVTIHPKMVQTISLPMAFDYQSLRIDPNTDGVLDTLTKACTPLPAGSTQLPNRLNLTFGGKMKVWGLSWIWKPEFSFNVGMACPNNAKDQDTPDVPSPSTTPPPATAATPSASGSASTSGGANTMTSSGGNSATASATPTPSARP
ncbi:MAG: hypothetical protein BYD32DRAFT_438950 [Podila humilis]|nr:MAG: hypothetical protein BYD32DRAFT_438950 [Podila humilis]